MRLPLCLAAAVALLAATPAGAEDAWNPFTNPDQRKPKAQPQPPPADHRPPLAPMDGTFRPGLIRQVSGRSA